MNIEERCEKAKERLKIAKLNLEKAQREEYSARLALESVFKTFDVGERVKVQETCHRGCCVEFETIGKIVGTTSNGRYRIQSDNPITGEINVSSFDIERINKSQCELDFLKAKTASMHICGGGCLCG